MENLLTQNTKKEIYSNNPSKEYLFIGGQKDGQKMNISDDEYKVFFPDFISGGHVNYYKFVIFTRNTRLAVFVSENLSEYDVLDYLVRNYENE